MKTIAAWCAAVVLGAGTFGAVAGECPLCGCPGAGHGRVVASLFDAVGGLAWFAAGGPGGGRLLHEGITLLSRGVVSLDRRAASGAGQTEPVLVARPAMDLDMFEELTSAPLRPSRDASPAALKFVSSLAP